MSAQKIKERIEEIKDLEYGWFDGKDDGNVFDKEKLDLIQCLLVDVVIKDYPDPYIYACPDNEISLEWDFLSWAISADFNLSENKVFLHALNFSNNNVEHIELEMVDEKLGINILNFLNNILKKRLFH